MTMKRKRPMAAEEAKDALADALRRLDHAPEVAGWRENLAYHLEQRTTILCGERAHSFTDGLGGG